MNKYIGWLIFALIVALIVAGSLWCDSCRDWLIIAEGVAQAQSDWMTSDYVPFTATLTFAKPSYSDRGTLILKKDNPSGLPEHDAALEVPIKFK